jgi:hypothetical protein
MFGFIALLSFAHAEDINIETPDTPTTVEQSNNGQKKGNGKKGGNGKKRWQWSR